MICRWQARGRIWERGVSLSWGSTNALPHGGLCPNHSCHTVHAVTGKFLRRIDPPAAPPPRPALVTIGTEVGRVFARDDAGQTVVLVALMFTVLIGFAALGIDIGRFYAERRYIQDAVDASALACARDYSRTGNVVSAWNAGFVLLRDRNLLANPLGMDLSNTIPPQGSEVYDGNVVEVHNLNSGILPTKSSGVGCRVAITVDVPTVLIKIVSPNLNTI